MKTLYRRYSVVAGFALLLLLLAGNAWVIRRQVDSQVENHAWFSHSQQVLFELSQTESLIKDAETGQRGYLYTEDPQYLGDYQNAVHLVAPKIDKMAQLTADNPRQQERVARLRALSQAKLHELTQTISLFQSGKRDDAKALVLSDEGLLLMNDIRKVNGEMVGEEQSLAATRFAAYERSVRLTLICLYVACFIGALGCVLLADYILREDELRERHSRQMAEREEWFRTTLTSLGDAVIATDGEGGVTFLNPLAEQLTGNTLAAAKGKPIEEVFPIFNESTHLPVQNPVKKVMDLGMVVGLANHTVLQQADGTYIPIEDSAAPVRDDRNKLVGVVLVFRDATHERKSQELLRKTEKLAAAARLASTVAHEINNPLEAIINLMFLTRRLPDMPALASEYLRTMESELDRISHIARQTLGFYRESSIPELIDLPALIDSVLKIYSNKFSNKNITVERNFQQCPPILGMAGELKQVVANLISNAADALDRNGTLRISLTCVEKQDGQIAQISVEDNGSGIKEEHLAKIFEPFFTTKTDVGTGLGLWVTKEIVERHGGRIEVTSPRPDVAGTIFDIHLPVQSDPKKFELHS